MAHTTLDVDRIVQQTFIARAEHHRCLGSTSDRARECATGAVEDLPLLIVADQQTAGRGRGRNRWWTGRGSLAFSLLLDDGQLGIDAGGRPLTALAAAVAVVRTVAPLLPSHRTGIHWPNDVIAEGRKLAGVLVEGLPKGRQVIGIGLNTNSSLADAPPELQALATTLLELTGRQHDQTTILLTLLKHLEDSLCQLARAPREIGILAHELCLQRGKTLTIQLGRQSISGVCAGIAPEGALLLDTPEGRRKLFSGVLR